MESTLELNAPDTSVKDVVQVLAVDDDEDFCKIVKDLLEGHGYAITSVANPVKALELYMRHKDKFDLVILDYYMPGLDGGKTFEWLRKLNQDVKVILCSGAEELRLRQLMTKHKLDGYIHKPFRLQEALYTIKEVMGK